MSDSSSATAAERRRTDAEDGSQPGGTADASTPPGPDGLPLVGSTVAAARDGIAFGESLAEYGDVVGYRAFGQSFVAVFDPAVVEAVLVSRNDEFRKGEFEQAFGELLAPDGLAFTEGERWRNQRRLLQPAFTPDRVRSYADAMVAAAADSADGWDDGAVVALRDECATLTLRILARTLFDLDFDGARASVVRDAVEAIADYTDAMGLLSVLPDWMPTPVERRYERRMAALDDLVATLVAERRAESEDRDDLLTVLLDAGNDGGMDADAVRDQLVTFLFAGHETTATALTAAVWLLAGRRDARQRLDAELDGVLGGRDPGFDDLADLDYTAAVAREALRLHPPAFAVYRQPREDTTLGGYRVTSDQVVQLSPYNVHRDDRWWDAPDEFRPERWLGEDSDRPEYAYFPFGGGSRHCIGMRFAMTELKLTLATLAQRARFERVGGFDPAMRTTLDPGDVRVRVEKP